MIDVFMYIFCVVLVLASVPLHLMANIAANEIIHPGYIERLKTKRRCKGKPPIDTDNQE